MRRGAAMRNDIDPDRKTVVALSVVRALPEPGDDLAAAPGPRTRALLRVVQDVGGEVMAGRPVSPVPAKRLQQLKAAAAAEQRAQRELAAARKKLTRELRAANDAGASLRSLGTAVGRSPSGILKLLAYGEGS
jgi:hypothetical protein